MSITDLVKYTFTVEGTPRPKGSKRAFVTRPKNGKPRAIMVEQGGDALSEWMDRIRSAARDARGSNPVFDGPLDIGITFYFQRPKSHARLKGAAPDYHTSRPDIDKLARAALDAMQGIVFGDDSQVAALLIEKQYAAAGGATIDVARAVLGEYGN